MQKTGVVIGCLALAIVALLVLWNAPNTLDGPTIHGDLAASDIRGPAKVEGVEREPGRQSIHAKPDVLYPFEVIDRLTGEKIVPDKLAIGPLAGVRLIAGEGDMRVAVQAGRDVEAMRLFYQLPRLDDDAELWVEQVDPSVTDGIKVVVPYHSGVEARVMDAASGAEVEGATVRVSHYHPRELEEFRNSAGPERGGSKHPRAFDSPVFLQLQSGQFGGVEWRSRTFELDSTGRGALDGLPCGPAMVEVIANGYSPTVLEENFYAGKRTQLTLELRARPRVQGVLRDSNGNGVPGASVLIVVRSSPDHDLLTEGDRDLGFGVLQEISEQDGSVKYGAIKTVKTDEAGRFSLQVPRGFAYGAFCMGQAGYAEAYAEVSNEGESAVYLELTLGKSEGRRLRIVGENGQGMEGVKCRMTIPDDIWYRQYPEIESDENGYLSLPWATDGLVFSLLMDHPSIAEGWDIRTIELSSVDVRPRFPSDQK